MRIIDSQSAVTRLLARRRARMEEAEALVRPILDAVRRRGDRALLEYARRFDGFTGKSVRVPEADLRAAERARPAPQRGRIMQARPRQTKY